MSEFVGEFDVTSRLTDHAYHCRFSHLWNGMATRHSDTVDTKFLVDGNGAVVGLAHTGFIAFKEKLGRDLSDREASYIAAQYCWSSSSRKTSARCMMFPRQTWRGSLACWGFSDWTGNR